MKTNTTLNRSARAKDSKKLKPSHKSQARKSAARAVKPATVVGVGRQRGKAAPRNGHAAPVQWKNHLDMYPKLRAVQFSTAEDFAAAGRLLWSVELRDLPYDLAGHRTVIVPEEAVRLFKGLSFAATDVLSPDDLTAAELAELRREQGPY